MVATTRSSLFVALFALVASSFRTRAALQASLRHQLTGFSKERAASLAPPPVRPALVGRVVPILVRLAAMSADGSARHGPPLAPQSFRMALDQKRFDRLTVPFGHNIPRGLVRARKRRMLCRKRIKG